MASTINAQISPFTAVVMEADDTGNLALQTANVTALTLDTNQNATFANTISATTFVGSANASSLTTGTVPTARLATGTANSSTYLRGDSTWAALSAPNNGTLTMATSGTGLSGSATFTADQSGNSTFTVTSNATSDNTAGAIVARDGSGNFSANNITAAAAVYASGTGGFYSSTYVVNSRNPIWRFGDASAYGISYFQASAGIGGQDTIGFHFGTATATGSPFQFIANGNFVASGNVTAFSDERLKKDWSSVTNDFVERLAQVKSGVYTRTDSGERQAGASAQDMQKILPEVVQDGGHLSLAYGNAALVAAIELAKQVVELKKEIELLKAK
jgi:hypothetical protein